MGKYDEYFMFDPKPNARANEENRPDMATPDTFTRVMYLDQDYPKGAFYLDCNWFWKGSDTQVRVEQHVHDFDEVLAFFGSDPENPNDLCGEIELWIEDEKHILTRSCAVFVPAGIKHCPLRIKRVNRPIFEFTTGPAKSWVRQ